MDSQMEYWTARALLEWQVELGVTDAICEAPIDRFALEDRTAEAKAPVAAVKVAAAVDVDAVAVARRVAAAADSVPALRAAIEGFDLCALRRGAHNLVFAEGAVSAAVMVIGGAPTREDDRDGVPFVGREGRLLDRMFAAIAMARSAEGMAGLYLTMALPWRLPRGAAPKPEDIAMLRPFVERHIALVRPKVIVLMGGLACQSLLGRRGMTRLRGQWADVAGIPALPMYDPEHLLRHPHDKRAAWADLLALQARLREMEHDGAVG